MVDFYGEFATVQSAITVPLSLQAADSDRLVSATSA